MKKPADSDFHQAVNKNEAVDIDLLCSGVVQVNCKERFCFLRGFAIYLFALISVNVKCALIVLKAFQQNKLEVLSFGRSRSLPVMHVGNVFLLNIIYAV